MKSICFSLTICLLVGALSDLHAASPNILFIVADDLGYGELGCQGNEEIPTPNIDSIAKNGIRFTNGYVTAAYCSASRAGFITGRYQARFGYDHNPIGADNEILEAGLPTSERTLAQNLNQAGYVSGLIGKWHLGAHSACHPLRRGFDEFYGFMHEGHYYAPMPYKNVTTMLRKKVLPNKMTGRWTREDGQLILTDHMGHNEPAYDANNPLIRNGQPVIEEEYLTDVMTRESVDFITRNKDNPFFLYLSYNAVHSPLQAKQSHMKQFAHIKDVHRRIFAGMLTSLDESVGEVLGTIRKHRLEENTLIVFISDNGGPTKELTSSNLPLRGGKGTLYEGGIRVPFLMQWKNHIPSNDVYDHPVISLDIFETANAVCGHTQKAKPHQKRDGVNLIPYLTGKNKNKPHETLYWRAQKKQALRHNDWKLVMNPTRGNKNAKRELYNLENDISESKNLAKEKPDVVEQLSKKWNALNSEMKDQVWHRKR